MKKPLIRLIGVGGGGCNGARDLAQYMMNWKGHGISSVLVNTEWLSIEGELPQGIDSAIGIGEHLTKKLGACAKPDVGYRCAMDDRDKLENLFIDAGLIFLRICLGGGTGSGAGLAIAEMAEDAGHIAIVGLVTTPFNFEGARRLKTAALYKELLSPKMNLMICKSNERLRISARENDSIQSMFEKMEKEFLNVIQGISMKFEEFGRDGQKLKKFLALDGF